MDFINPIEILSLKDVEINEIDNTLIKKAKRKVQADIELSDNGYISVGGTQLSKTDAERIINELEDRQKLEFYHYIAKNVDLNRFLSLGDEKIFHSFRQESIYKLTSFINFISPFFSDKYDKALVKAFQNNDDKTFKRIISIQPLITEQDKEKAFKNLSIAINKRIKEVEQLSEEIKNGESSYDENDIDEIYGWIECHFNVSIINSLPQYFQSLKISVANSIRNLSVNIFNSFSDSQLALNLIGYALSLKTGGLTEQRLTEDFNQIKDINARNLEEERIAPILQKYASIIIGIKNQLDSIEKLDITAYTVQNWVNSTIVLLEINSLDSSFQEIKNQIAIGLRALSVGVWNKLNDINASISIITRALAISTDLETKKQLNEAKSQLDELKKKIDLARNPPATKSTAHYPNTATRSSTSNPRPAPAQPKKSGSNKYLWFFVGLIGLIILINITNSNEEPSNYDSESNNNTNNYDIGSDGTTSEYDNAETKKTEDNTYSEPIVVESQYKGNQLSNGASPLNGCFGKGKYAGSAWIEFDNSNNSDALVCLVKTSSGKTIRNEYIRAGSNFKMSKIPSGTYYLKVYYGNDWNPTKENFCGTKGAFDSNEHFQKSDNQGDLIEVSNTSYSYTTGSITLYTVPNGNMSVKTTSEADFFQN